MQIRETFDLSIAFNTRWLIISYYLLWCHHKLQKSMKLFKWSADQSIFVTTYTKPLTSNSASRSFHPFLCDSAHVTRWTSETVQNAERPTQQMWSNVTQQPSTRELFCLLCTAHIKSTSVRKYQHKQETSHWFVNTLTKSPNKARTHFFLLLQLFTNLI